ncbi:hypothetical protein HNR60_001145 [Rhodopseudomonas rhenobacensis]|uniref:Uncharacterized protein n=1 Tax=Rhodopseudomonas rhenobacensis TaxID=87461 RepID=A0A7W8DY30_9BRAD|nr:hypothetical protein [Rhodopseudomonas rhenobacensis]MBB5046400.1 hypothetical protein [Rhodopseudomonas rhenobacensis]
MISFATDFPIEHTCNTKQFVDVVRGWILGSPHTVFTANDLNHIPNDGSWVAEKASERIQLLATCSTDDRSIAIRRMQLGEINWETTIVFSQQKNDSWVGVRVSREASHPAVRLPPAKKPLIVGTLLENLGGALDGRILITSAPLHLSNNDIELASSLIRGRAGCRLPVVYLSCGFEANRTIDASALAYDLAGMAHVVVEPNRPFSRRLQIEVQSENVYGGVVGIYWPDGQGRRSFFDPDDFDNCKALRRSIIDEVRTALLNRRPLSRCTWAGVQEAFSQSEYARLKSSGSREVDKYTLAFDAELNAVKERLSEAENEIARLQAEVRKYESDTSSINGLFLSTGTESELYSGELRQFVYEALVRAQENAQADSRREHVLGSITAANHASKPAQDRRESLKELLRSYKSMDGKTQRALETLGFTVSGDGKHYKLVFQDDDRYTFVLPKSGSDFRGGLNAVSDIAKRLF